MKIRLHLFFSFLIIFFCGAYVAFAQSTRYVSPRGADTGNCPVGSPCATVNYAIGLANPGDVVQLAAGTYNQQVIINKSITLIGAGAGSDPFIHTIITGDAPVLAGRGISLAEGVENISIKNLRVQQFSSGSGIYGHGQNNHLIVQQVQVFHNLGETSAEAGIHLNGPIANVNLGAIDAQFNSTRGIVIWNGRKENITITGCTISNNSLSGLELQDGTAAGVTIQNNIVENNKDSGISLVGLSGGAGANLISGNTITNNGRFGMEIKLPDGTGLESGDGSIVIAGNQVSRTQPIAATELRDMAGIAVYRRNWTPDNVDVPQGVVIKQNTVRGYRQPSTSEGFGIVAEGNNMTIAENTISDCEVATQMQAGHLPFAAQTNADGDQSNLTDQYFGRGNTPGSSGIIFNNIYSGNAIDVRYVGVPEPASNEITWAGTNSSDWTSPTNWREELVPSASNDVYIPESTPYSPVIETAQAVKNITVAEGATLEIKSGTLEITGEFKNEGNIVNNGNGQVAFNGEVQQHLGGKKLVTLENLTVGEAGIALAGPVKVNNKLIMKGKLVTNGHSLTLMAKNLDPVLFKDQPDIRIDGKVTLLTDISSKTIGQVRLELFSSPFTDASFSSLKLQGENPDQTPIGIFQLTAETPSPDNLPIWNKSTETDGLFSPGQGYRIEIKTGNALSLTGNLQTGKVTVKGLNLNNNPKGSWQLLGNPYAAPLDWQKVKLPEGMNQGLYTLTQEGKYSSYINGIGTATEGHLIPAMQGFLVWMPEIGAELNFDIKQLALTKTNESPANPEIRPLLQLELTADNQTETTILYFQEGATNLADLNYDAYKLPDLNISAVSLFSQAGTDNLAINGLAPLESGKKVSVPLVVRVAQPGSNNLTVNQLKNFSPEIAILLEDKLTGAKSDLRKNPVYHFETSYQTNPDRFLLHFEKVDLSAKPVKSIFDNKGKFLIYPNPVTNGKLKINLTEAEVGSAVEVIILNNLGQPINRKKLKVNTKGAAEEINLEGLNKGVYILQMQTDKATTQTRLVVE
jgi:hypothetical protein